MRVSYNWLKEYVDLPLPPAELADRLTNQGVKVEAVESLNKGVSGVVVGVLESVEKHPGADNLLVTRANIGGGRVLQIVTGATNVKPGRKYPVAPPGARLVVGEMKVASLRGVESHGMLCSADELGIDEGHEIILELPDDAPVGADCVEYLGLNDTAFDLDLTPNYAAHCQAMAGVAREVAAMTGGSLRLPRVRLPQGNEAQQMAAVEIADPDLCHRYVGLIIKDVKIGPSPGWLQARIRAAGMRPISNIVDVTNYVMWELGQPLHAFDYDTIAQHRIIVRRARAGEKLVTLDGVERTLDPDMLLIADPEKAVGLAGVMGGLNSEVTESTRTILLESAWFEPINNRRTARRLGLPSEASARFTKGVDPSGQALAAARAALLMAEVGGGTIVPGVIDVYPQAHPPRVLPCRPAKLQEWLGLSLSRAEIAAYLGRLGCTVLPAEKLLSADETMKEVYGDYPGLDNGPHHNPVWEAMQAVSPLPEEPGAYRAWAVAARAEMAAAAAAVRAVLPQHPDTMAVVVPTRRPDISIEVDLYEEVCRIHGYDKVPATIQPGVALNPGRSPLQRLRGRVRRLLAGFGLTEAMTYSLTHPGVFDRLRLPADDRRRRAIAIQNPLYEERSVLRTTMLPSMLDVLQYNASRGVRDVQVFDIGNVYAAREGQELPDELHWLAIAAMGDVVGKHWNGAARDADFFWLKGVVEALLRELGAPHRVETLQAPYFHPGRQARLSGDGGRTLAYLGELHPEVAAAWNLPGRAVYAALPFAELQAAAAGQKAYKPVPRFPAVVRDVALVVSQAVPAVRVEEAIRQSGGELLESVRLFDVYQGEHIKAGHRSLAFSLTYRAPDRTLTEREVDIVHGGVRKALIDNLGAELRS